jgi:hypothetical protein
MNLDLMAAQLYAMRAQCDALIMVVDEARGLRTEAEAPKDPAACPNCGAPEEKQVDASTLDGKRATMCLACGRERPA